MPDPNERLVRCFASVFPTLPPDGIPLASVDSVEWDSLASVTLVAVLEQEFAIQIDIADLPELSSFASVRKYLSDRNVPSLDGMAV
ncbi:MAG: acyl carrier protein [Acidobacteriaceae bacterium]|nr:acyl carrier protein [Acidobacteriaceae bacterium]MBV9499651.1 acyl carrier protein [Acidobacteriaceae bacterium]